MFDFRITPAQVLAAYAKTEMKPTRGAMYIEVGNDVCGCGLGAMFVAHFGGSPYKADGGLHFGPYLDGFIDGFDDRGFDLPQHPLAVVGKIDGRECARAVFGFADW